MWRDFRDTSGAPSRVAREVIEAAIKRDSDATHGVVSASRVYAALAAEYPAITISTVCAALRRMGSTRRAVVSDKIDTEATLLADKKWSATLLERLDHFPLPPKYRGNPALARPQPHPHPPR